LFLTVPTPYLLGQRVSLSGNGKTAIIGDWDEKTGGAGWVFTNRDGVWQLQGPKLTGHVWRC